MTLWHGKQWPKTKRKQIVSFDHNNRSTDTFRTDSSHHEYPFDGIRPSGECISTRRSPDSGKRLIALVERKPRASSQLLQNLKTLHCRRRLFKNIAKLSPVRTICLNRVPTKSTDSASARNRFLRCPSHWCHPRGSFSFLIAAFCRLAKSLTHSEQTG
jgi:hypothetical protein